MSDHAFASLTPTNAIARLAFSDVYGALTSRHQSNQAAQAALRRMFVQAEQTYDDEIVRLRREMERTKYDDEDGQASETLTEPDTDVEKQLQKELGMVWVGKYLLELQSPPVVPERGAFAKTHDIDLRNPHGRFNFFPESKGFYIMGCSRSPSAQLTVNGDAVARRPYHLNQHTMKIQLGKLEYRLQWTEIADKDDFLEARRRYVAVALGGPPAALVDFEMPTPLPNPSGNVAAIKMVERTSRNCHRVDNEIQTFRGVTDLARVSDYNYIKDSCTY